MSRDKDFSNPLDAKEVNPYLAKEWREKNGGEIIFLDSIISLLHTLDEADKTFEQSYISEELDKLINSSSFSETHTQINKLLQYVDSFTKDQIFNFFEGYFSNPQINWIASDNDISHFLELIQQNQYYSVELRKSARGLLPEDEDIVLE